MVVFFDYFLSVDVPVCPFALFFPIFILALEVSLAWRVPDDVFAFYEGFFLLPEIEEVLINGFFRCKDVGVGAFFSLFGTEFLHQVVVVFCDVEDATKAFSEKRASMCDDLPWLWLGTFFFSLTGFNVEGFFGTYFYVCFRGVI